MLTKHEPAPACNHCNEEHVYVVNIVHVMMYVPRSQCSRAQNCEQLVAMGD